MQFLEQLYQLPSIQETISKYKLSPNKKLGQNFLLDTDITDKIVRVAGNLTGINIIEIGPGAGTLTRSLIASDAKSITAIELDRNCILALEKLVELASGKLKILQADALKFKEEELLLNPVKIIANLPYNIGTELILKWLHKRSLFSSITVMLQKEVVDRIIAQPGTKDYGRLSIISQFTCEIRKEFEVPPQAFFPAPKVFSAVVTLVPRRELMYDCDLEKLENCTRLLFQNRRKMIRAILKNKLPNIEEMLSKLGIMATSRPEVLTIKNFCDIANLLF